MDGTRLSSKGTNLESLTKSDYEADRTTSEGRLEKVASIAKELFIGGWPVNLKVNFVLDGDLLEFVYKNEVIPRVQKLFEGVRSYKNVNSLVARLGNYYGLQRFPIDQKEQTPNQIPRGDSNAGKTDEDIVESNVFKFALFNNSNVKKFTFKNTNSNKDAISYALGATTFRGEPFGIEKSIFRRKEFPKHIASAVSPFIAKVSKSLTPEENLNLGISEFLKEFPVNMSEQPTQDTQTAPVATTDVAPVAEQPVAAPVAEQPAATPAAEQPAAEQPAAAGPAATEDVVAKADAALATTEEVVESPEQNAAKCDLVKQAADKAITQTETLLKSIEEYEKQADQVKGILARKDRLIEELLALKTEVSGLKGTSAQIQLDLVACRGEKKALEDQLVSLKEEIAKLQARIKSLEDAQSSLSAYAQKIMAQIEDYESKVDEIFDLKDKITLQQELVSGKTDEEKYATLESLANKLDARAKLIQQKIKDLTADFAGVSQEGDAAVKESEEARKKLESLGQDAIRLQEQIDKKTTDEAKLKQDLASCADKSEKLSKAFDEFCKSQSAAFQRVNEKLAQVTEKVNSSIASLSKLIEEQKKQTDAYASQVQSAEAQQVAQPTASQ